MIQNNADAVGRPRVPLKASSKPTMKAPMSKSAMRIQRRQS
ncbi:hypothetical protein [Corynebacterium riegelii]|nr:hypothetical protein [Corynebacterium riegelii]